MITNEIQPNKLYSLYELVKKNAFPHIKSYNSYLKLVLTERDALDLQIIGEGKGTTYRIKGESLIKFLNEKQYGKREEPTKKVGRKKTIKAKKIGQEKRATARSTGEEQKADVGRWHKVARKVRK